MNFATEALLLCLFYLPFIDNVKYKKALHLERINNCPDAPEDALFYFNEIKLTQTKQGTNLYAVVNITETINNENSIVLEMKRCKNKDNLDTCENWSPIRVNNFCPLLKLKNQPWSETLANAKPPMTCPITKDVYTINGTFDFGSKQIILPIPIDSSYWRGTINFFSKNKILKNSICLVGQIKQYKL